MFSIYCVLWVPTVKAFSLWRQYYYKDPEESDGFSDALAICFVFLPTSQKPRGGPAAQNEICPPAKVRPNPVKIKCSQLAQSCLPQSGCCDSCATCHCRFFNVICFCRKTKSQSEKNRQKETPHHITSETKSPTHATGHWSCYSGITPTTSIVTKWQAHVTVPASWVSKQIYYSLHDFDTSYERQLLQQIIHPKHLC